MTKNHPGKTPETPLPQAGKDEAIRKGSEPSFEKSIRSDSGSLEDLDYICFEDLFTLEEIQRIQDQFAAATGVAAIITKPDGTPITQPSNFCRLCMDIIRKTEKGLANCIKSDALIGRHHPEGPIIQPCMSGGLWDAGAGITAGGKHIANWLIGQVRDEKQTEEAMRAYARKIDVDENKMIDAFHDVPSMSKDQFEKIAQMLFTFANKLSESAYQNLQKAYFINERQKIETILAQREEKYRALVESSMDLIWEVDNNGFYTYISPQTEDLLGCKPDEMIGKTPFDFMNQKEARQIKKQCIDAFKKKGPLSSMEYRRRHKNGKWVVLETNGVPILDADGTIKSYVGIDRDITDRKATEDELANYRSHLEDLVEDRTATLEAKNKELETFTYSVSHDLKAPLRGIDGYSRLLVEDYAGKLDEEGLQFLGNIRHCTEQMHQLIEDLLTYSRMERRDLNPSGFSVRQLIDELIFEREHEIKIRSVHITIEIADDYVVCDRDSIRQILGNFIDNAIKFTADEAKPKIEIGLLKTKQNWWFSVKDNGIGFDPKYHKRIFGIFQRLHRTEDFPGTGIGLALVKKAVSRMNGQTWAESTPGQGATFHLKIPYLRTNNA